MERWVNGFDCCHCHLSRLHRIALLIAIQLVQPLMIEDRLAAVNSLIEELNETRRYLVQKRQFYRDAIAKRPESEVAAIRQMLLRQALRT